VSIRPPNRHEALIILIDIQMPVINGYEATRQIKADPNLTSIPVVVVSSFAMKGDEEKARAAGCDEYVTKPYSPIQLLRMIRGYLGDKTYQPEVIETVDSCCGA
jgi:two-component system cell cycle response regulator DivK